MKNYEKIKLVNQRKNNHIISLGYYNLVHQQVYATDFDKFCQRRSINISVKL